MIKTLCISLLPCIAFFVGCATGPLNVVPVSDVKNEARLDYGFGENVMFHVVSEPVKIKALVPHALWAESYASAGSESQDTAAEMGMSDAAGSLDGTDAAGSLGGTDAAGSLDGDAAASAAVSSDIAASIYGDDSGSFLSSLALAGTLYDQDAVSGAESSDAGASLSREDTTASIDSAAASGDLSRKDAASGAEASDIASSTGQSSSHTSLDADAAESSQDASLDSALMHQTSAGAYADAAAGHSSISGEELGATEEKKSYQSDVDLRHSKSEYVSSTGMADYDWRSIQPYVKKRASQDRVVIGEQFEYLVEVRNRCPLPLTSAEVSIRIEPHLSVQPSDVRSRPNLKFEAVQEGRFLKVVFLDEIQARKNITIEIPVLLR